MAFAVVTSLLGIVEQQLLQPNPSLVLYNREMIVSLSNKLQFMQAFLEESGTKTNDSQFAKETLDAEIRDVASEVEGKIESELRQVYLAANRGECVVAACQRLHKTLQQIAKDIEGVEVRLMEKTSIASPVGFSTNDFKHDIMVGAPSQSDLEPEKEVIVGFVEDKATILKRVINKQLLKREVIALQGEGGIGKTTLAKRVFEDQDTTSYFHIRAWVVVSQDHNFKEMFIGLLRQILPVTSEISMKEDVQLAEQLCRNLMGQKYLIVLDDIWTAAAWDAIKGCFPENFNGSRILITTRFIEVALYLSENPHIMKYQTLEASWQLFAWKVFGKNSFWPPEFAHRPLAADKLLEYLGLRIIRQCGKLPLAIVVIAGLLATVKKSVEIWRDVEETLAGIDIYDDNRILKILSFGYNYLPSHLKACFLYFGNFPKGSDIPVKKLINLWVAEGFLKTEKNKSLEEVAVNCLCDLINRSLIQVNGLGIDGKIKSCKIHDRLHEICVREAKKENIVSVFIVNHAPEASRWISCQSSYWPITRASHGNHTSDKIHSIFYFGKELYLSKCKLLYPCLKLLRVLDLSLIKYLHSMPNGIADLIHLRYLALSTIGSLYKFRLLKLQNLQTLIICSWMEEYPLQLPCDILDLAQLRHLQLEKRCSQYLPSLVRENLQTLYWLKVTSSNQKPNFRMVPNLKELGIYIEGELAPGCLESLVHLHLLKKLKFEIGRVERFYLPTAFPSNLKKLTFRYTYLPWKDMDTIGKLANLEVLKLKDFAFYGPEWEPIKGGFQGLKVLLIARSDLKLWNASVDNFPVLERLVLRYCWELKRVPIGLSKIKTLKSIVLESCHSFLVTSADRISYAHTLRFSLVTDHTLRVLHLGAKVELPNNESSEEESTCGKL